MKIFAYDLETTGTSPGKHGIHQIGFFIIIDGKEKERVDFKVRPNPLAKIEQEALDVAGVTLEEIMTYPLMEQVYKELIQVLGKYVDKFNKTDKFFLLGYNNASFDDNFFRGFFLQNGDQYFGSWFWADPMDVRVLAIRQLAPVRYQMPNFKLMTVAKQLGIEVDESKAHDAFYDISITYEVFKKLRLTKTELEGINKEYQLREKGKKALAIMDRLVQLPVKIWGAEYEALAMELVDVRDELRKEVVS